MSEGDVSSAAVMEFADGAGLAFAPSTELPSAGELLGRGGLRQHATATGTLPGGERGTLCLLSYTYRSDDHTRTVERTAVVTRLPESIGFAPYLATEGSFGRTNTKKVELDGGGRMIADQGIDEGWLAELLSPAFTQWIQRSPEGFAWELADGVLCASVGGFGSDQERLRTLCEDAAQVAQTVREECLEEVDTGEAGRTAAKAAAPSSQALLVDQVLDRTTFDHPPENVAATRDQFRRAVTRMPATYLGALGRTILWMIGINIIGGGLYGLLLNLPNPGLAVLVYQLLLLAIVGPLVLRSRINGTSAKLAEEGFWREYARTHDLRFEDPSTFAATHAKAELPGKPVRVLSGTFDGVAGSLMITGDGAKRGDSIALVGGPQGPTASEPFDVSAPGPSTNALDEYAARLAAELRGS